MKKSQLRNIIRESIKSILNEQAGSCPGWPGYQNWVTNFTSLPNFSSPNPNQPCQFICQRYTQWTNQMASAGPVWQAQLQCKTETEGSSWADSDRNRAQSDKQRCVRKHAWCKLMHEY